MATALAAATSSTSYCLQNWSDLPDDLLQSILLRLFCIRDILSFSSVCRSWRSLATSTIAASPTSLFPPLLIYPLVEYRRRRRLRRHRPFSSALELLDPAVPRPIAPRKTLTRSPVDESILSIPFLSSSHGHLLFLTSRRRRQILVVNFITGHQITSPVHPLDHHPLPDYHLAQLTAPISSPGCTLIYLTVDYLLLWRINSHEWISRPLRVRLTKLSQMVVVGRQIVALGTTVWVLELENMLSSIELPQYLSPKELVVQCLKRDIFPSFMNARLVDSEGEILFVCFTPCIDVKLVSRLKVEVFQFNMFNDHVMLVEKNNLGNRALFLSEAENVPGCVCNDPERWGGKSNCIYFPCTAKEWFVMEVGHLAPPYSIVKVRGTRAKCLHPFWDYASILQ